jgi:hypothetical protein
VKNHLLLVLSLGVFSLTLTPAVRAADAPKRSLGTSVEKLAATIDTHIAAPWGKDIKPAARADDAEFFRRIHLDLAGRIPSVTEIRDFLDDDRPDKRRLWVDRILQADADDPSYKTAFIDHFTNVWRGWLLAQTTQQVQFQQPALDTWLRNRIKANLAYDQMVRELLTEQFGGNQFRGNQPGEGSAAIFYQANEFKPENLAGSTARLFLGVKLECAQCHNHPFDKWTRTQFWQFAGFFTDVAQGRVPQQQGQPMLKGQGTIQIAIAGQEKEIQARFLDGKEPKWKDGTSTRPTLVEWMTAAENPYFAKAIVNRMWSYFFGAALVGAGESPAEESPASHKELLDQLSKELVAHHYDLKFLIRAITASQAYQRTSAVSDPSQKIPHLFQRMPLRGLSPEQLFDSLAEATEYSGDTAPNRNGFFFGGPQGARGQFLTKFVAQEQKTDYQTSILQALYLMNNEFIADRINLQKNRTLATLAEQRTSTARKIESLYLVTLSRKPRPAESTRFVQYVDKGGSKGDSKQALADVFWVLLNSPEFLLNH